MDSLLFYNNLLSHEQSINELLCQPDAFQQIPEDWQIIVTDIKGSTQLVKDGLSEIVNLIATGSIIAAINIAKETKVDIPFFFGGDGATLLVPPTLVTEVIAVLVQHQHNVKEEFNIHLRIGSLQVSAVYENNCELKIAKVNINALYTIPIILGNGLHFAEKIIKYRDIVCQEQSNESAVLNLEGMECTWDRIPPPKNTDEVVCLLISAIKESEQGPVFKKILDKADEIYGSHKTRNPISLAKLQRNASFQKIKAELKLRQPKFWLFKLLKNWFIGFLRLVRKSFYFISSPDKGHLNKLIQSSDTFVLDGRINMIISGRATQRKALVSFLDELENKGDILYGIYVSKESVISCFVRTRDTNNIHFIDGSGGGYTHASILLKEKIQKRDQPLYQVK